MGIPHHLKTCPPIYVCWRDVFKDQMLARGYISDNWHFPDGEFQQIVTGMTRLKPVCDELATASAANNMASMQEIAKVVFQLVNNCGKKLTKTSETNNYVPPPSLSIPPYTSDSEPNITTSQRTTSVPVEYCTICTDRWPCCPKCSWPNAPGPAQNVPAPRQITKRRTLQHPQGRPSPKLRTILLAR